MQNYPDLEIVVSDNCSTDKTQEIINQEYSQVKLVIMSENKGGGPNMDNCVKQSTGSIIVFLCHDDIFTDLNVISDMAKIFDENPSIGYIGHWYYQFLGDDPRPVRIHRSNDPYFQADNQSGLGFRKIAIRGNFSTSAWIEGASMVKRVLDAGWDYRIIQYDTVGVRIHPGANASTQPWPYLISPTLTWVKLVGERKFCLTAFISLVQFKNWGKYRNMLKEIWYFIVLKPSNLFRPDFWFFSLIAIFVPKTILRPLTQAYKKHFLSRFIRIAKRNG